jgi:hypothetical protein
VGGRTPGPVDTGEADPDPLRHAQMLSRRATLCGMADEGWYADPRVEPVRWRWWDGTTWTDDARSSRAYPLSLPVTGRWSRAFNFAFYALVLLLLPLAGMAAYRALFPPHDPGTVYITQLNRVVDPRSVITTACPQSVRGVKHFVGYSGVDNQEWSVTPVEGHVDRAFLNVDSGAVTCP